MLADLGIPYVTFDDADALISFLAASERLLSLRVHGALPAWTLGLDVTLLGIDRRALLGDDFEAQFRVIALRTEADFRRAGSLPTLAGPQQGDAARRQWLRHHLGLYVENIRRVVSDKLGRPLPDGVPLHAGGEPEPHVPAITVPAGRYFSEFFYSDRSSFPIRMDKLISGHRHEVVGGTLVVTQTTGMNTLAFGPYILVPKGSWLLTAKLRLEAAPGQDAAGLEGSRLVVQVLKGVPGRVLARETLDLQGPGLLQSQTVAMRFENESDTGVLETVFSSAKPLPEGTRLIIEQLQLTVQLTVPA